MALQSATQGGGRVGVLQYYFRRKLLRWRGGEAGPCALKDGTEDVGSQVDHLLARSPLFRPLQSPHHASPNNTMLLASGRHFRSAPSTQSVAAFHHGDGREKAERRHGLWAEETPQGASLRLAQYHCTWEALEDRPADQRTAESR